MNILSSPRTAAARERANEALSADPAPVPVAKPLAEHLAMGFGVGLPFLGLLAAVVLLWGRGVGWLDLSMLGIGYVITALGVTVGFHRLFTHRAAEVKPVVRLLFGIAGSMSNQGPVIQWCAVHRRHHQHSDRDGDPHSPHLHGEGALAMLRGMWHAHVGWLFAPEPVGLARSVPDLVADPVLCFVDKYCWLWVSLGWAIPAVIGGLVTRTWFGALTGFLWGGLARTFLLHHVTWSINSVCHVWGGRPFDGPDESRNNAVFGVLAFGEGWHNNHHAFPTSARHGLRWWQIDMSYWLILLLRALRLARNVRVPSPAALEARLAPAMPKVSPKAAPAAPAAPATQVAAMPPVSSHAA